MWLTVGLLFCPLSNSATAAEITTEQQRQIMADTAALLAENEALRESLTGERQQAQAVVDAYGEYRKAAEEQNALLKQQAEVLNAEIQAKNRQLKRSKNSRTLYTILGLGIGAAVGATVN